MVESYLHLHQNRCLFSHTHELEDFVPSYDVLCSNIMTKSSHCFWKHNRNSGHRFCINGLPRCWVDYYFFTPTIRSWQWSQQIVVMAGCLCYSVMKVMVWQFMSNSHEVMTVPIGHVIFELLLWRFICSFIDMVLCSMLCAPGIFTFHSFESRQL
jgi:hypothetical protein